MAEPLPAASSEAPENLPANAEDRAAAVALSALKTTTAAATDDAEAQPGTGAPSKADQEALGKAMSRLETLANAPGKTGSGAAAGTVRATGAGKKDSTVTATTTTTTKSGVEKKEEEKVVKKPAVKVKAEDVSVLVDQLDLTKLKATELLKVHEGDLVKAMRAFVVRPTATA